MSTRVETPADLAGFAFESALTSKATSLKNALISQTLKDIESWRLAVDVQWHNEHPGQQMLAPTTKDDIKSYGDNVRDEYYSWVEPTFARYLTPDPDALNPMIETLRGIESTFGGSQDDAGNFFPTSPALARVNDIRSDMHDWQGDLQENFIDNFLTPLQTVSLNQAPVAKVVREQLECCKVTYIRSRRAILTLLDTSIEAVKALNNDCDPKTLLWGTLVATAVGTGMALVPGLLIAGTALSIGATLLQGLIPDPLKTNKISAATAQEVAVNIVNGLNKLDSDLIEEERRMETAFRVIDDTISRSRRDSVFRNTSGPFAVATPELATARPGDITDGSLRPAH